MKQISRIDSVDGHFSGGGGGCHNVTVSGAPETAPAPGSTAVVATASIMQQDDESEIEIYCTLMIIINYQTQIELRVPIYIDFRRELMHNLSLDRQSECSIENTKDNDFDNCG